MEKPIDLGGNIVLASGNYNAIKVTVEHSYTDVFHPQISIEGKWRRLNSVIGFSSSSSIDGDMFSTFFPFLFMPNEIDVTMRVSCFQVFTSESPTGYFWIPAPPQDLKTTYSLLLNNLAVTDTKELTNNYNLSVFPNPADETVNVTFDTKLERAQLIEIFNASGRLIYNKNLIDNYGDISIDISHFSSGLYLCKLTTLKGIAVKKFIKL